MQKTLYTCPSGGSSSSKVLKESLLEFLLQNWMFFWRGDHCSLSECRCSFSWSGVGGAEDSGVPGLTIIWGCKLPVTRISGTCIILSHSYEEYDTGCLNTIYYKDYQDRQSGKWESGEFEKEALVSIGLPLDPTCGWWLVSTPWLEPPPLASGPEQLSLKSGIGESS